MPASVNLLAELLGDERFGAAALAGAEADLAARGARLVRAAAPDDRLAAWIDWRFAPSWWSSDVRAGSAWYAERDGEILGFAGFGARDVPYPRLRRWRATPGVAVCGPVGVAEAHRGTGIGAALLTAALAALRAEGAARALFPAVTDGPLAAAIARRTGASVVDRDVLASGPARRTTILAGGGGTNAQAVIDGVRAGRLPLTLAALVANDPAAAALGRARDAGLAALEVVWDRSAEPRATFDARVADAVARTEPELVLLLGWMHLLPPAFLARFPETLNLHPAFLPLDPRADVVTAPDGTTLPAFRGGRAIQAALAAGAGWLGASVHRVTAETDRGAILVRTPLRLGAERSVDDVVPRLRPVEHAAVGAAIRRWAFEAAGA